VVFEYDADGKLLEYHDNDATLNYYTRNENTATVECWVGSSGNNPDEWYGVDVVIPEGADYRCYTADMVAGSIIPGTWVDVTGTDAYTVETTPVRKVVWDLPGDKLSLVRLDTTIMITEYDLTMLDGVLDFNVEGVFSILGDNVHRRAQTVPMGHYELYLNRHILIPGLDYTIQFPNRAHSAP
jgi:hypothetical protein